MNQNYQHRKSDIPSPEWGRAREGAEPPGRFLSPDPFVQSPTFSQSYNRYSYCFNNPLRLVDPSGYNAWKFEENPIQHGAGGPLGYQGNMGTGSGYHWSYGIRSKEANFNIMSERTFVSIYGQDEYNKQINYRIISKLTGKEVQPVFQGAISFGLNASGKWQMIAVTSKEGEKFYTPYLSTENIQMMTILLDDENEASAVQAKVLQAGNGFAESLYLMNIINSLYDENATRNLTALEREAVGQMKVTGRVTKSTNKAMNANKFTKVITNSIGKKLYGVGLVFSAVDVIQDPSASNIAWNVADGLVGFAAFVPGFQIPALIYFTARISYDIYDEFSEP